MTQDDEVRTVITAINAAWRENDPLAMQPYLHPDITLVFPGFAGTLIGRDALLASFLEFCRNATVREYREHDLAVNVIGATAVVTYRFDMVYERAAYREHSTGRDLWILARQDTSWIAVWRTMMDLAEKREQPGSADAA
jgi:uncharacterized protein (TIGR02246 family)